MFLVGDLVDAKDWKGQWYHAIVLDRRPNGYLVTFLGYGSRYNETIKFDTNRVVPLFTFTSKQIPADLIKNIVSAGKDEDSSSSPSFSFSSSWVLQLLDKHSPVPKDISIVIHSTHFPGEPVIIEAHKLILAAQCSYFTASTDTWKKSDDIKTPSFSITERNEHSGPNSAIHIYWDYTNPVVMHQFFQLFYGQQNDIYYCNILEFARLADFLQFTTFDQAVDKAAFNKYIQSTSCSYAELCDLSEALKENQLRPLVQSVLLQRLTSSPSTHLDLTPVHIIQDLVNWPADKEAFLVSLVTWYKKHPEIPKTTMKNILKDVSWHLISPKFIFQQIYDLDLIDSDVLLGALCIYHTGANKIK